MQGTISITAFGQTAISYGSVEASLISENAKEDEKKEKNQKEGRDDKEKVPTLVTVFNKAKMEEYKKNVEVEVLLTLEEYTQTENTFNNKKYKISFGKLYDENLAEIINFSWKENGSSDGTHDLKFDIEEKKLILGDFTIKNLENKENFYKEEKIMGTGHESFFDEK